MRRYAKAALAILATAAVISPSADAASSPSAVTTGAWQQAAQLAATQAAAPQPAGQRADQSANQAAAPAATAPEATTVPAPPPASPQPAQAAAAAPTTSQISGTITDAASGEPIAGACVTAYNGSRQTLARTCTGADGRYTIGNARAYGMYLKATVGPHAQWWPGALEQAYATRVDAYPGLAPVADFRIERRLGTVRGSVTRQDGAPAVNAAVFFDPVDAARTVGYTIAFDGGFQREIPVGRYHVSFSGSGYTRQWHPARAAQADAAVVEVTDGGVVELTEQFLAVDPIPAVPSFITRQGRVLAQPGATPVPDAQVTMYATGLVPVGTTRTDAEGRFTFPNLFTQGGVYTKASAPGFATAWMVDDPEPLTAMGANLPISITLRAGSGRLLARISDHDGSLPYPGTTATLSRVDSAWSYTLPVRFDGTIDLPELPAGQYRLQLHPTTPTTWRPQQWYPGELDSTDAGVITITDGQTTEITETLLGPAVVEVTLRDAVTGATLSGGCVLTVCTDVNGTYRVVLGWQPNSYGLSATHAPYHYPAQISVTARPGEITPVTLTMQPGAVVATTYQDRVNTYLFPDVCVYAVQGRWGMETDNGGAPVCGRPAADGSLLLGPFQPGYVQLFVRSRGIAGAQWLGYQGGTGDRRSAATLLLQRGAVTTAPTIVAAESGSVHGIIREAVTNRPVPYSCAQAGPGMTSCGDGGFYNFSDLGPYQWVIAYSGPGKVTVRPGEAGAPASVVITSRVGIAADPALRPATVGQSFTVGGTAPTMWNVLVYDALTREMIDAAGGGAGMALPYGRHVVVRLDYDGHRCWAYLATGSRLTPYYQVGVSLINKTTLTPGQNCLDSEPKPMPQRMPPASPRGMQP
ncbi:carboxypeptidase regulatory-like domain-containing protein [Catellatospora citrea]|uniref:carboxypeptidase regulatory-like domain-containing protein n=1 Tax=Catellatospora citrea TaxID=53366 RepID=UPI0033DCD2C4